MSSNLFINDQELRKNYINYLKELMIERRFSQILKVLNERTRYITVVLEDIFQSQNASAVLRTCDCLGIQDVHIIENRNKFNVNPKVVMGSSKWLSINRYNKDSDNTMESIIKLKSQGYRIVATTPHSNDISIENYDLNAGKIALFFGTEQRGLSQEVLNNADDYIKIPMFGFTESFNISVSAAIVLYTLMNKLRSSEVNYKLQPDESELLLLSWLESSTKNCQLVEKRFLSEFGINNPKNTCKSI